MALAVAGGLLAASVGAGADTTSVEDRNVAWFLAQMGLDVLPEGEATVRSNGVETRVSADEGLRLLAARAGGVDIAAIAAAAGGEGGAYGVGDVWALQYLGLAECPDVFLPPLPGTPNVRVVEQAHVYSGHFGYAESPGLERFPALVTDWTTKQSTGGLSPTGVAVLGNSDWFCLDFGFGSTYFFPFVDGYVCALGRQECGPA